MIAINPTYLIDTNVISDFIKGHAGVVRRLLSVAPNAIAISSISEMEVEYGLLLNEERAKKLRPKLKSFFEVIHIIPFDKEDAHSAAQIRADLKKSGTPIGPYDILLAGSARNHKLIFVTANMDEFTRVKGLKIENWRKEI